MIPHDELDLVGLTEKKAKKKAQKAGWHIRVLLRDDKVQSRTNGYRPDRVNVSIRKGLVEEVLDVG